MLYEWDPRKARQNLLKHGVRFDHITGFDWKTAITRKDLRHLHETRMIALGFIDGRLYNLVYTVRDEKCRVISLRKANTREVRSYVETQDYLAN